MKFQKVKLQMVKETAEEYTTPAIKSTIDIVNFINKQERYDLSPNEKLIVIGLDTKSKINIYAEVVSGAGNYASFAIADIFKPLLISNSTRFILVHNHPSGDATPSTDDLITTKEVQKVADMMKIKFLDHIVIGENNFVSIMSILREGK